MVVLVVVNKLSSGSFVSRMDSQSCLYGKSMVSSIPIFSGVPWFVFIFISLHSMSVDDS